MIFDNNYVSNESEKYKCPRCKDTGQVIIQVDRKDFYGTEKPYMCDEISPCPDCNGGHERKVVQAIVNSDIPDILKNARMKDFNWNIYRSIDERLEDTTEARTYTEMFIEDFQGMQENGFCLFIYSRTKGSGKTFLASCIANELMAKYGFGAKFASVGRLVADEKTAEINNKNQYHSDPIKVYCDCPLLILDDMGAVNDNWTERILFRIIDTRLNNHLPTIYTSNFELAALENIIDDRQLDRMASVCFETKLPEISIRTIKGDETKKKYLMKTGRFDKLKAARMKAKA